MPLAPVLLHAALGLAAPLGTLAFVTPAEGEVVTGEVPVEVEVAADQAVRAVRIGTDDLPARELPGPPYRLRYEPQGASRPIRFTAEAVLASGERLVATRQIEYVRVDDAVDVSLFLTPVTVTDREGRNVAGLSHGDFRLEVDGDDVPISHFEGGEAPFSLGIVLDCSSSMVGERFHAARDAARLLVRKMGPRDRGLVIGFDHRARVETELTSSHADLLAGLDALRTGGGTSLFDALALAIRMLAGEPGRKAVVILSDGEDAMSRTSPGDLERAARRSQVVLYPVWIAPAVDPTRKDRQRLGRDAERLRELAAEVGGRALFPTSEGELAAAYATVFDEMRSQYTIGFAPPFPADGRWHRIKVRVDVADVSVRARKGWLAEPAR